MRTIDADALLEKICRLYPSHPAHLSPTVDAQMFGFCNGVSNALFEVDRAPTVDAEPVRHGQWITAELRKSFGVIFGVKCSLCGDEKVSRYNYCPNCGAKMRGDDDASE